MGALALPASCSKSGKFLHVLEFESLARTRIRVLMDTSSSVSISVVQMLWIAELLTMQQYEIDAKN